MTYEISGTWRFQDVMQLGGPHEIKEIRENQHTIQFDEPANIQFTSVSYFFHLIRVAHHFKQNYKMLPYIGHNWESQRSYFNPPQHCEQCIFNRITNWLS